MSKPKTFTYTGNPGYTFALSVGVVTLAPGDEVALTDAEVSLVGDDFTETVPPKTNAPKADPKDTP